MLRQHEDATHQQKHTSIDRKLYSGAQDIGKAPECVGARLTLRELQHHALPFECTLNWPRLFHKPEARGVLSLILVGFRSWSAKACFQTRAAFLRGWHRGNQSDEFSSTQFAEFFARSTSL